MLQLISAFISTYLPAEKAEGQGMVECALIIAFVALVAIVGVTLLGTNLQTAFTNLAGKFTIAP